MKLPQNKQLLDDIEQIRVIDTDAMLDCIAKMPEMAEEANQLSREANIPEIKNIKQIIFGGMGGSAIGGDIARALLSSQSHIPCHSIRSYNLPSSVDGKAVIFLTSYSGNTEEVISLAKDAEKKKNKNIIVITSGGQLEKIAIENKYKLIKVPDGLQPRAAIAYLTIPIIVALEKIGALKRVANEINETIKTLAALKIEYGINKSQRSNQIKQLAAKVFSKVPIIFGSSEATQVAAYRWRTQFNENSKIIALNNVFPELNHNEIVGLGGLRKNEHNFSLILLREEKNNPRIDKRIEITKSLLSSNFDGIVDVYAKGKTTLSKIFSLIYYGDLLSVYCALLNTTDPTPVNIITKLKKELTR